MFRHGKPRGFIHNLRLASMLSFVAGSVNIAGVLSLQTLTTNVTGHFAFFAEDFVQKRYELAIMYVLFVLSFLLGAFVCNMLVELALRWKRSHPHLIPMLLEAAILASLPSAMEYLAISEELIANALLFSMGLQNALVTKISLATVRTTHLTGLFTDLGIELSQLFFHTAPAEHKKLTRSIYLRLSIIVCFFIGGVFGGFMYTAMGLNVLLISSVSLLLALYYDSMRLGFHQWRRKVMSKRG